MHEHDRALDLALKLDAPFYSTHDFANDFARFCQMAQAHWAHLGSAPDLPDAAASFDEQGAIYNVTTVLQTFQELARRIVTGGDWIDRAPEMIVLNTLKYKRAGEFHFTERQVLVPKPLAPKDFDFEALSSDERQFVMGVYAKVHRQRAAGDVLRVLVDIKEASMRAALERQSAVMPQHGRWKLTPVCEAECQKRYTP